MAEGTGPQPVWLRKQAEGKMFERRECDRCGLRFNFGASVRITRVPTCPACGSLGSYARVA